MAGEKKDTIRTFATSSLRLASAMARRSPVTGSTSARSMCPTMYPVKTMWTTLPPDLRDGLVLDVGA